MVDYSCLLAYSLLGSQLIMQLTPHKNIDFKLNKYQEEIYSKIKQERLNIFIKSFLLGMLISYTLKNNINYKNEICYMISFTLLLTNIFYLIHPKSIYLISVLESKYQIKAWLEYYKYMQFKSKMSILLSGLSFLFMIK